MCWVDDDDDDYDNDDDDSNNNNNNVTNTTSNLHCNHRVAATFYKVKYPAQK